MLHGSPLNSPCEKQGSTPVYGNVFFAHNEGKEIKSFPKVHYSLDGRAKKRTQGGREGRSPASIRSPSALKADGEDLSEPPTSPPGAATERGACKKTRNWKIAKSDRLLADEECACSSSFLLDFT